MGMAIPIIITIILKQDDCNENIQGGEAFVYVLIEHKSAPDVALPLQLAGYMVQIWLRHAGGRGLAKPTTNHPNGCIQRGAEMECS